MASNDGNSYVRCPRCELNFVLKKDKYCAVCKREMAAAMQQINSEDDIGFDLDICPICKTNYIRDDEDICASCARERDLDKELNGLNEDEENESGNWHTDDDAAENDMDGVKPDDEYGAMVNEVEDDEELGGLGDLDLDINIDEEELDFDDVNDFDDNKEESDDDDDEDFDDVDFEDEDDDDDDDDLDYNYDDDDDDDEKDK